MKICPICKKEFDTYSTIYCSLSCSNKARTSKNAIRYLQNPKMCKGCKGPIPYHGRWYNTFCSASCSARFNNTRREKKVVERTCLDCGIIRKKSRRPLCDKCVIIKQIREYG